MKVLKTLIRENPVRARAALVALVSLIVPAGIDSDAITSVIVAVVALWFGHSAGKQVVTHEVNGASTDEALSLVEAARVECCGCPHVLPEPNEPHV
ncbi:hypothetical protein ACIQU6_07515 [Streptomyces sp. NPDC090442]|uniref:hypothetical protein n=1 Tax=Streptomyces sp. NPDC090442 TaxID=3365962 RepID=UPI00381E17BF